MRLLWLLLISFSVCTIATAHSAEQAKEVNTYWTCPMHPEVHSAHSGDCPICHMKLILKEEKVIENASKITDRKSIQLDQKSFNLSGAKLHTVTKGPFNYNIKTFGKMNGENNFSMYVSEKDQRFVKPGSRIQIKVPSQDLLKAEGVITKLDTYIEPMGRTIRVDGTLKLKDGLRAETSLLGKIEYKKENVIKVPEEAVLHTGENNYVFLFNSKTSTLDPTIVTTGLTSNGEIEIISGIKEGDVVTTHSNFLIDSESRMRFNYDQKNN
jgi:multidrug efflux pump subunit AcrA (membrane-fusion protein)